MSDRPGERLLAWISESRPGLSGDEERGRTEVVWIAASVWLAPVVSKVWALGLSITAVDILSIAVGSLINLALFNALATGRGWARRLTLALLAPMSLVNLWVGIGGPVSGLTIGTGETFTALLNGTVFGAAALMLWRSPTIRAYLESQKNWLPRGSEPVGLPPAGHDTFLDGTSVGPEPDRELAASAARVDRAPRP